MLFDKRIGKGPRRWAVAATVAEPLPLVAAFVAHHLGLGASEVWVFLDAPDEETETLLTGLPGCIVQVCTEFYWQEKFAKKRPRNHLRRQLDNIYLAHRESACDWVLHLDADEFLHSAFDIADVLAAVPAKIDSVTVPNVERVTVSGTPQNTIFDGTFRQPLPVEWGDVPDILDAGFLALAFRGLAAYTQGKSFSRTGVDLIPGVHSARAVNSRQRGFVSSMEMASMTILHFDGLTPLHWVAKLHRFATSPGNKISKKYGEDRMKQMAFVLGCKDKMARLWALYDQIKTVDRGQLTLLSRLGLHCDVHPDICGALRRFGLQDDVDLTVEAFDRALAPRFPLLGKWHHSGALDDAVVLT